MNSKLEQAITLVAQKKHKKALLLIKKIHQKPGSATFKSLELESGCLFEQKSYPLAYMKLQSTLELATNTTQKINTLDNLSIICEKINKPEEALQYLRDAVDISGATTNPERCQRLILLAHKMRDHETVKKYAPALINLSEFSMNGLLILGETFCQEQDNESAYMQFKKAAAEIIANSNLNVIPNHIIRIINGFVAINKVVTATSFVNAISPKFQHQEWFEQATLSLSSHVVSQQTCNSVVEKSQNSSPQNQKTEAARVSGTSIETVKILEKLLTTLTSMGAVFNDSLAIVESDGDIAVHCSSADTEPKKLMNVPLHCMPLLDDYRYSLDEALKLTAVPRKNAINVKSQPIMALLVEMFNATDKIKHWRGSYPLFNLVGFQKIINKLLQARSNADDYRKYCVEELSQLKNETLIESFVRSRVFTFSKADLRASGIKLKPHSAYGFIPVIELINHKIGKNGFQVNQKTSSLLTYTAPGKANREVFVQYNLDDPFVTFLTYGFVDMAAPWIYSIPVVLHSSIGMIINVANQIGSAKAAELPVNLRGLALYLPAKADRQGNQIFINKLIIPGSEHIHTLRAALTYVLKNADLEGVYNNPVQLELEVERLELQLIEQNKVYWQQLQDVVNEHLIGENPIPTTVAAQLVDLCDFYLKHIDKYAGQTGTFI
jgi:tetratricopeptide (TPR) repeat protein